MSEFDPPPPEAAVDDARRWRDETDTFGRVYGTIIGVSEPTPYDDIAEVGGCSPNAAKKRLDRLSEMGLARVDRESRPARYERDDDYLEWQEASRVAEDLTVDEFIEHVPDRPLRTILPVLLRKRIAGGSFTGSLDLFAMTQGTSSDRVRAITTTDTERGPVLYLRVGLTGSGLAPCSEREHRERRAGETESAADGESVAEIRIPRVARRCSDDDERSLRSHRLVWDAGVLDDTRLLYGPFERVARFVGHLALERSRLVDDVVAKTSTPADSSRERLDARDLPSPHPLQNTLERLTELETDTVLVQVNDRPPQHLYPKRGDRGYTYKTREVDDTVVTAIRQE